MVEAHSALTLPLETRLTLPAEGEEPTPICEALLNLPTFANPIKAKLDTCAAVSIAHREYLTDIKHCRRYGKHPVRLRGIGGQDPDILPLVGKLSVAGEGKSTTVLCYVYDKPLATCEKLCLIGMRDLWIKNVDINYHIDQTIRGLASPLKFISTNKRKPMYSTVQEETDYIGRINSTDVLYSSNVEQFPEVYSVSRTNDTETFEQVIGNEFTEAQQALDVLYQEHQLNKRDIVNNPRSVSITAGETNTKNYVLMTEIQLRNILDRLDAKESVESVDGQETMAKGGRLISKFCAEAMNIPNVVPAAMRKDIYKVFDLNAGDDSVFPTRNGCPKVLAKYVDNPYSYELLPEYESGEKSLPKSKAPYWDGKDATCRVIRQFCKDTPIVSPCKYPLCI